MPGPLYMPKPGNPGTDEWEIEILEDGRIKITTGATSPAIHTTAEKLLGEINKLAGGEVTRERRPGARHEHGHHGHHHRH